MTLVVVGSAGIDTVETPHGRVQDAVGGSAVYCALAASLFTRVRVAANLGHDYPREVWDFLERERGADLDGLQVFPDRSSFRWSGRYEGAMNDAETLRTELNVLAEPPAPPASFQGAAVVFLANMGPDVQLRMCTELRGRWTFADTMNLWIEIAREDLLALLRRLDGLILNDAEARMLTGEDNLVRAGRALQALGPGIVVVKKGEHGAMLFAREELLALPAFPVESVVDPTGAGDSFAGGFLGAVARAGELSRPVLRQALAWGTVTASFTVQHFSVRGLQELAPAALEARYRRFLEHVRVA